MSSILLLNMLTVSLPLAAIILLLLILSRLYGRRVTAKCRYIIWAAVILRLCAPFGAVILPSMLEVDIPAEVELAAHTAIQADIPVVTDAVQTAPDASPSAPIIDHSAVTTPDIDHSAVTAPDKAGETPDGTAEQPKPLVLDTAAATRILSYIWLAGAVIFLAWKLTAYNSSAASLVRSSKTAGKADAALYNKLCSRYGIKRAPVLLVSGKAYSPMLCGYFKARIILPDIGLSSNALVGILAHELTHYRRRDLWMKLLCVLAESLHWWNPLAHIAAKRCNSEMELSCDEAVLAGLDEAARRSYGSVMLDIIKRCQSGSVRNKATLTTQFNPRKNAVKERFYGIMDMTKKKRGLWLIAAVVLICSIAGAVIGCNIGADKLPEGHYYREGLYLKCDNGSDMILIEDYNGDGSLAPCSMTAENESVSFTDLTDGDRIKIEVMLIGETYPMQTQVYSIEKLSDGERSDIDAELLARLAELGWIAEKSTDDKPAEATVYYPDDPDAFLPPEATRLIQRYNLPLTITFFVYETEPKSLCIYSYQKPDNSLTKCDAELPDYAFESPEIIYMYGGGSGEGFMEVRFAVGDTVRYENYGIYVGDTTPCWRLLELSGKHKRSAQAELKTANGTVAYLYHDVPGNWFLDSGIYYDENGNKRTSAMSYLYQNYSLGDLRAELSEYEDRTLYLDTPITGETYTGIPYTIYWIEGEYTKGKISRRYFVRFEIDGTYSYVADVWEHTYIDGANYFDTVLLPVIKSFSFDMVNTVTTDTATGRADDLYISLNADSPVVSKGQPLAINSIGDWEKLGLTREDYRYPYFEAFLSRDTAAFEKLSNRTAGLYDSYKQLGFGDYRITKTAPDKYGSFNCYLDIEITQGTDALPAGNYQFIFNEYPGNCLQRIFPVNNNSSEAYVVLKNLLNSTRDYALDGGNEDSYNWGLTEYIINVLGKNKTTAQNISDYADRYFGIGNFVPNEACRTDDGYYTVLAHGAGHIISECISDKYDEASDEHTVTVQFYADYGMTVYSHRVAYRMKYDGIDWVFLGYEVQSKGEFEPYKFAT